MTLLPSPVSGGGVALIARRRGSWSGGWPVKAVKSAQKPYFIDIGRLPAPGKKAVNRPVNRCNFLSRRTADLRSAHEAGRRPAVRQDQSFSGTMAGATSWSALEGSPDGGVGGGSGVGGSVGRNSATAAAVAWGFSSI